MDVDVTAQKARACSVARGFHDNGPIHPLIRHMLMVSEIAEATEEVRHGKPPIYFDAAGKPEGEAVELADCVIRIMEHFATNGWSLAEVIERKMAYNETRPYRHGGKSA